MTKHDLRRVALTYAGALALGYLASLVGFPLPWMIGAIVFAGLTAVRGVSVPIPVVTRFVGQTVVAAAVGLSFTPAAMAVVGEQIVPMIAIALLTILAGFLVAAVLMRLTRIDAVSASLASIPGGPVEMAALASRHAVPPGPVAFAQTLRIALIVMILPPLIVAVDGRAIDPATALAGEGTDLQAAGLLLLIGVIGGFLFRAIGMTSPFFLGPLGLTAAASAMGLPLALPPYWVIAAAQVLLGVWLGRMFDRRLLERSKGFFPAVFASTLLLIVLCALMAIGVSVATGMPWQTAVLATAPGNVTEMALTAKVLQQGVALVAAYHIVRIFIILPAAPLIFGATARIAARLRKPDAAE